MKKVSLFILFASLYSFVFSQNSTEWSEYASDASYSIEQKDVRCSNLGDGTVAADYIFLKLTNKTNKEIKLSFQIESYFDEKCRTCNSEFYYTFTIPANQSIEPNCKWDNGHLAVIKDYVSGVEDNTRFTKFMLTNITVK